MVSGPKTGSQPGTSCASCTALVIRSCQVSRSAIAGGRIGKAGTGLRHGQRGSAEHQRLLRRVQKVQQMRHAAPTEITSVSSGKHGAGLRSKSGRADDKKPLHAVRQALHGQPVPESGGQERLPASAVCSVSEGSASSSRKIRRFGDATHGRILLPCRAWLLHLHYSRHFLLKSSPSGKNS